MGVAIENQPILPEWKGVSLHNGIHSACFHGEITVMHIIRYLTFTEKKIKMAMPVKEYMTMEKRKQLRMTTKDATSLRQLHKEV